MLYTGREQWTSGETWDDERGAIRPGSAADIIATPDNPLESIQTLKSVFFVMKDGAIIRNNAAATR